MSIRAVVFDFDETIAEVNKYILKTILWKIKKDRLWPRHIRDIKYLPSLVSALRKGDPYLSTMEIYKLAGREIDKESAHNIVEKLGKVVERSAENAKVHRDAKRIIPELKDKGYTVVIYTKSSRKRVEKILKNYGLLNHVDVIVTGDDVPRKNDRASYVIKELNKRGIDKNEVLFVGDLPSDVQAARSQGVKVAIVKRKLFGVTIASKKVFKKYNSVPDYYIPSLKHLHKILSPRRTRKA